MNFMLPELSLCLCFSLYFPLVLLKSTLSFSLIIKRLLFFSKKYIVCAKDADFVSYSTGKQWEIVKRVD